MSPRLIDSIPEFKPQRNETQLTNGNWLISVKPPELLGPLPTAEVVLTPGQYDRYLQWRRDEGMIQYLLPELSDQEREKLLSGLMPDNPP